MHTGPIALAVLLLLLGTGCSDDGAAPVAAPSASGTPTVLDETGTPAGNRWWIRTRPHPDDRTLDLVVHEQACASGQPATDRIRPVVDYADDSITVTISVEYAGGDQSCPGNPDTAFTLPLAEPIGDRAVHDGRTSPPTRAQVTYPR